MQRALKSKVRSKFNTSNRKLCRSHSLLTLHGQSNTGKTRRLKQHYCFFGNLHDKWSSARILLPSFIIYCFCILPSGNYILINYRHPISQILTQFIAYGHYVLVFTLQLCHSPCIVYDSTLLMVPAQSGVQHAFDTCCMPSPHSNICHGGSATRFANRF